MTDPDRRHVSILVDRSGSMQQIAHDTEGGIAAFIEGQKEIDGKHTTLSLAQFDTVYDAVYSHVFVDEVPVYRLMPRGGTALWDAIARTIGNLDEHLLGLPEDERPAEILVVIATDGEENSSREVTNPNIISAMVTNRTDAGWEFIYIGANQDAIEVGSRLGFRAGQTMTYDADPLKGGTRVAWASVTTNSGRGSRTGDYSFTNEERKSAMTGDNE
jgi:uncharacterized protein YegL